MKGLNPFPFPFVKYASPQKDTVLMSAPRSEWIKHMNWINVLHNLQSKFNLHAVRRVVVLSRSRVNNVTMELMCITPMLFVGGSCREAEWRLLRAHTALDGRQYVAPRTIRQCLDHCDKTAGCVAVDIDVDVVPLRCWMHMDADDLDPDNIYTQLGTDHYQLVKRCPHALSPPAGTNIHNKLIIRLSAKSWIFSHLAGLSCSVFISILYFPIIITSCRRETARANYHTI